MKRVIAAVIVFCIILCLCACSLTQEAPFFGVTRGDSPNTVERRMGKPDYFEDNGLQNFNYYYENIKFLDMTGSLDIHFELSMVDSLRFKCTSGTMDRYDKAVSHYTKKYGAPHDSASYTDVTSSSWIIDEKYVLLVAYHPNYRYPTLSVEIFR